MNTGSAGKKCFEWTALDPGSRIIQLPRLGTGNYFVRMRCVGTNAQLSYNIVIHPRSYRGLLIGVIIGAGILLVVVGFLLLRQKLRFRKRERRLKTDRQLAELQNQVYRSQLNPHFIFNALSSIQALMNKGETVSANDYLSDFAGLLRHTLDAQKSEFWTLDDELTLLRNYVKLEQLRFSFRFELTVQEGITPVNHTFPAMLLQPVVENAIRHGLLHDDASTLAIRVRRTGTDLVIAVENNGRGFDPGSIKQGDGLRLTHERIDVINRYGSTFWELSLQTRPRSTMALFTGKHYFQDDETRA